MKALVFDGALRLRDDYPAPVPAEGEALVRVLMAGICNTDLEITRGYQGFSGVPGHEFVGVVEEAPESFRDLVGRRVVGEINASCGRCGYCMGGMRTHCPDRTVLGISGRDGAFAQHLALPAENLHAVPEGAKDEEAVFVEPLAAAFEISEQLHLKPTHRVLVMGDGKLGILCALALSLSCADVALLGRHEEKLALVSGRNVRTFLDGRLKADRGFDIVVEATGTADGLAQALGFVRPRGTVVLKSTVAEGAALNLSPVVVDEVMVLGSRCGPFGPALGAISKGLIDVKPLITAVFPVESALEAFALAGRKGTLKVLLDFR